MLIHSCLDQYATTIITATVFATEKNTVSAYNSSIMAPQGPANVTATVGNANADPSECVCLRTRDDADEGQDEICTHCIPDGGYGNLPSWRADGLVRPSITKAVQDLEDTPRTIPADSSSGIAAPMSTSMLPHMNTTVAYKNESSIVRPTVVSASPPTASLTSTAYWSSEVGNSTITGSSVPTNDAAVGQADSSSSGYMVSPNAKHSVAFWIAMWAVLAWQIEGGLAGLS